MYRLQNVPLDGRTRRIFWLVVQYNYTVKWWRICPTIQTLSKSQGKVWDIVTGYEMLDDTLQTEMGRRVCSVQSV